MTMVITCPDKKCKSTDIGIWRPSISTSGQIFEGKEIAAARISVNTHCYSCGKSDRLVLISETDRNTVLYWDSDRLAELGHRGTAMTGRG